MGEPATYQAAKAGVESTIQRLPYPHWRPPQVGGPLGIAILGSVVGAGYIAHLNLSHLSAPAATAAARALRRRSGREGTSFDRAGRSGPERLRTGHARGVLRICRDRPGRSRPRHSVPTEGQRPGTAGPSHHEPQTGATRPRSRGPRSALRGGALAHSGITSHTLTTKGKTQCKKNHHVSTWARGGGPGWPASEHHVACRRLVPMAAPRGLAAGHWGGSSRGRRDRPLCTRNRVLRNSLQCSGPGPTAGC